MEPKEAKENTISPARKHQAPLSGHNEPSAIVNNEILQNLVSTHPFPDLLNKAFLSIPAISQQHDVKLAEALHSYTGTATQAHNTTLPNHQSKVLNQATELLKLISKICIPCNLHVQALAQSGDFKNAHMAIKMIVTWSIGTSTNIKQHTEITEIIVDIIKSAKPRSLATAFCNIAQLPKLREKIWQPLLRISNLDYLLATNIACLEQVDNPKKVLDDATNCTGGVPGLYIQIYMYMRAHNLATPEALKQLHESDFDKLSDTARFVGLSISDKDSDKATYLMYKDVFNKDIFTADNLWHILYLLKDSSANSQKNIDYAIKHRAIPCFIISEFLITLHFLSNENEGALSELEYRQYMKRFSNASNADQNAIVFVTNFLRPIFIDVAILNKLVTNPQKFTWLNEYTATSISEEIEVNYPNVTPESFEKIKKFIITKIIDCLEQNHHLLPNEICQKVIAILHMVFKIVQKAATQVAKIDYEESANNDKTERTADPSTKKLPKRYDTKIKSGISVSENAGSPASASLFPPEACNDNTPQTNPAAFLK